MSSLSTPACVPGQVRLRENAGWRTGRPVEDPEKTKRWGYVTARPSEYLVHVRRGAVSTKSSGQGATCFKWPRDAVAIIPTSLQRLQFKADQVTLEKVGVEVVGLAVYRIAEPLLAYSVLNFSFPERAQEKLEQFLNQMEGELSSVIPYPVPKFQGMGVASKVKFLLVVERTANS